MSTFYVLPSRSALGERFAGYLQNLFPGLGWDGRRWPDLADTLATVAGSHSDVFVVYREDFPDGEDFATALTDGFGASAGDEVIEVSTGGESAGVLSHRWRIGDVAAAAVVGGGGSRRP